MPSCSQCVLQQRQGISTGLASSVSSRRTATLARKATQTCPRAPSVHTQRLFSHVQKEYEAPRLRKNTAMMVGLHTLQRSFGGSPLSHGDLAAALRSFGMGAISSVPAVRNQLLSVAMGDL